MMTIHLIDIIEFYIDLNIKNLVLTPIYEADWTEKDFFILEEQYKKLVPYLNWFNKIKPLYYSVKETKLNYCGACKLSSSWDVYGNNFPCQRFNKHDIKPELRKYYDMCLGYLDDGEFNHLHYKTKESFINFTDNPPEHCLKCEIYGYNTCNGGCYAVNYEGTGDIKGIIENQCRIKKINFKINKLYAKQIKRI